MSDEATEILDALDNLAREHCHLDRIERVYQGEREVNITDSGAISTNAEALCVLAKHGRFRIVRGGGRIVVGYWPEHDPENKKAGDR